MATWILFLARPEPHPPLEVGRCDASSWDGAASVLSSHVWTKVQIAPRTTPPTKARPFFVQSAISHAIATEETAAVRSPASRAYP